MFVRFRMLFRLCVACFRGTRSHGVRYRYSASPRGYRETGLATASPFRLSRDTTQAHYPHAGVVFQAGSDVYLFLTAATFQRQSNMESSNDRQRDCASRERDRDASRPRTYVVAIRARRYRRRLVHLSDCCRVWPCACCSRCIMPSMSNCSRESPFACWAFLAHTPLQLHARVATSRSRPCYRQSAIALCR